MILHCDLSESGHANVMKNKKKKEKGKVALLKCHQIPAELITFKSECEPRCKAICRGGDLDFALVCRRVSTQTVLVEVLDHVHACIFYLIKEDWSADLVLKRRVLRQ